MKHKRSIMSIVMATIMLVSLCAVCASMSVSAAPSSGTSASSANVKNGLVGAPSGFVGDPAVCSQSANSLDLFIRGTDNAVWSRHDAGGTWGAWKSLGGIATSSPAAATSQSLSVGTIYVAVRGTNGQPYQMVTTDGGVHWSPWQSRGGKILEGTGPSIFFMVGSAEIRFAVTGTNHQLYWLDNGWKSLGGYLTSSPAAASWGVDRITAYGRGTNGALYARWTDDGGAHWSPWESWGGQLLAGTGPAVLSVGNYARYFVTGTNHQLYWYSSSGWASLGGYLTSSPAAASHSNGQVENGAVDVFVRGSNGALYSRGTVDEGAHWSPWISVP